jgi:hypothetical protein
MNTYYLINILIQSLSRIGLSSWENNYYKNRQFSLKAYIGEEILDICIYQHYLFAINSNVYISPGVWILDWIVFIFTSL